MQKSISLLKIACMGHQIAGFYSPGLFSRSTGGEVAVEQIVQISDVSGYIVV
jgi:hypothetical protein